HADRRECGVFERARDRTGSARPPTPGGCAKTHLDERPGAHPYQPEPPGAAGYYSIRAGVDRGAGRGAIPELSDWSDRQGQCVSFRDTRGCHTASPCTLSWSPFIFGGRACLRARQAEYTGATLANNHIGWKYYA